MFCSGDGHTLWYGDASHDMAYATCRRISRAPREHGSQRPATLVRVMLPAAAALRGAGSETGSGVCLRSLMAAEMYVDDLSGFGLGHVPPTTGVNSTRCIRSSES